MLTFAEEATYTYEVDTLLVNNKWYLIGGEVNNDITCPRNKIVFNDTTIFSMLSNPYVKFSAQRYEYNDGCNGGGGKLVYNDYLIYSLGGGSSCVSCNFWRNDTLKSISKVFTFIITNSSFHISNDTLTLQNQYGRIYLSKTTKQNKVDFKSKEKEKDG